MELYAAIDILGGECVRLVQGDFERRTTYGDPLDAARALVDSGARHLHVVDLDAARTGLPTNHDTVAAIARASAPVPVQAGGGIRDATSARRLLEEGVDRIVLGTAALDHPEMVASLSAEYPGKVALGLDHRAGGVVVRGWVSPAGRSTGEALAAYGDLGASAIVVTDVSRDGTLAGPDLDGLRAVLGATALDVVASGGIGSARDLAELAVLEADGRRLAGVIVGRALHDGTLGVREALAACSTSG